MDAKSLAFNRVGKSRLVEMLFADYGNNRTMRDLEPARRDGESFADYKKRRAHNNKHLKSCKQYPPLVWDSSVKGTKYGSLR